jgi:transposase
MKLTSDEAVEYRFNLICRLHAEGKSQVEIARTANCSQGWVSQVLKRHRLSGNQPLKVKGKAPGGAPKLTRPQLEELKGFLVQGALAYGFETDNWGRGRVLELIRLKFGVVFHISHMSKLLKQMGFTLQKPKTRSYRKDDEAVRDWKESRLPALKKSK